jgi:hypothetical protein
MPEDPTDIGVESLYGARTDAPLVKLIVGTHEVIIPPEKARLVGGWLIQAAEAAYGDAFLVRWLGAAIGVPREQAVPLLREFRTFRELQRRAGVEQEEVDEAAWRDRQGDAAGDP